MTMKRAYSILTVKAVDEDTRVIEGIASTPSADRMGDVVEPLGAKYKLPMPLLWQHQHDKPVGHVEFAKPTAKGIPFRAVLAKIDEPGALKDLLDMAWQSVKAGLVRGVSIGFNALEWQNLDTGGIRFVEWEWLELSLVTIPANSEASIQTIKSVDQTTRAALGAHGKKEYKVKFAGDSATPIQSKSKEKDMTYAEQLAALREKKAQHATRMKSLVDKSAEAGETLGNDEAEEFDTLQQEVDALEAQIKRVETLEKMAGTTAQPVTKDAGKTASGASNARTPSAAVPRVSIIDREEKGLAFARFAKCLSACQGNYAMAEQMAEKAYSHDTRVVGLVKAAVAAATTSNSTWAGALVGDEGAAIADFLDFLRPQTIVGQFGLGNIPSLRSITFRSRIIEQTSGGQGRWVGETNPKPVTKFDFVTTSLEPSKVAALAVLSEEVVRDSNPKADIIVRDQLVAALRERLDVDFIDPAKAAVSNESPASITYGVTPIASSGVTMSAIMADIRALRAALRAGNNYGGRPVLIMDTDTAESLAFMLNELGTARAFPDISAQGGTLLGFPVIVSDYLAQLRDTSGGVVVMVNADEIYLGDMGGFEIRYSREATLTMDDAPASNAQATFSLWQRNCLGILAERTISWAKRRANAAAYLTGVNW